MKRLWHVPASVVICGVVGFSGWLVADVWGQADPRAAAAPQNPPTGTAAPVKPTSGGGFSVTNDLGEYRLWDVPPGDYYVSASFMPYSYAPSTYEREGQTFGFAPTFYPGAASMEGARFVTVRAGQDTPSIDITMLRAKMGRITGTVLDSSGNPLSQSGGSIYLTSRDNSYQTSGGVQRRPDGSFMSSDLPPGDYYVVASQMQSGVPAGSGVSESAVAPVSIDGDEVTVSLQLNKGATISGKVVVEGKMPELTTRVTTSIGSQPVTTQARIMLSARSTTNPPAPFSPSTSTGRPVPMADDGTFELTGLRGLVRLFASGRGAVLKSVRRGGQDIMATPLELDGAERIADIEIVVTTETGTFEGRVTNSRGEPASGVDVIVFSDDPARWFEGSSYVRMTRSMSGAAPGAPSAPLPAPVLGPAGSASAASMEPGRIIGGPLVPGRYGAIAFESSTGTTGPAYDPETLEKLQSRATFFTVTAGQTATVQLKTVKP